MPGTRGSEPDARVTRAIARWHPNAVDAAVERGRATTGHSHVYLPIGAIRVQINDALGDSVGTLSYISPAPDDPMDRHSVK
jgi:hypothetical protein